MAKRPKKKIYKKKKKSRYSKKRSKLKKIYKKSKKIKVSNTLQEPLYKTKSDGTNFRFL